MTFVHSLACIANSNARTDTLRPRQNGRHFIGDIFKRIFLNENLCFSNVISLQYVPCGLNQTARNIFQWNYIWKLDRLIDNQSALFATKTWRRTDENPLPQPMITHFTDANKYHSALMSFWFIQLQTHKKTFVRYHLYKRKTRSLKNVCASRYHQQKICYQHNS